MANYDYKEEAQKLYDVTKELCDKFTEAAQKAFANIEPSLLELKRLSQEPYKAERLKKLDDNDS